MSVLQHELLHPSENLKVSAVLSPFTPAVPLSFLPRVIDNTIISTFRNCQHKAKWEFGHQLRAVEVSVDLHAGACFAKGLEVLYKDSYLKSLSPNEALTNAVMAFNHSWGDFIIKKETNKTRERVLAALLSYNDRYHPPTDYIEPSPLFTNPFEYSFALPLTKEIFGYDFPLHPAFNEPFIYAGKFDMIGTQHGFLRIRDDKTTTSLGATWANQWSLRSQLIGYVAAMQLLGFDVDTVELRGIGILKTDITHTTAVKTFTKQVVERWKWQLSRDLLHLVDAALSNEWEYNFSNECSAYGGCAFLDLCRSSNPEAFFDTFKREQWNPLSRPSAASEETSSTQSPVFIPAK